MADGTEKPIEDVKVGDLVLATEPETGVTTAKQVLTLIRHAGPHIMVDLTLSDGTVLNATDGHPIWDATTKTFTKAIDVPVGDKVLTAAGGTATITTKYVHGQDLTAYNLEIEGIHTYYAGNTPILVHNTCTTSQKILSDPKSLKGLTPKQIDDLARNAGYEILPGKATASNPATRYYSPGTKQAVGFRVLPEGVAGQPGIKGSAYLRYFGGPLDGQRVKLGAP
ncbi:hypothetical protein EH165_08060 [Nakamurella antarctica]|uniref:Uncharacterized protein n=1 Tax=Nakamurella antarctica TaxID=1902245 RepID=A0A3G8ZLL2_9ACTN|nr:polymorphic toxin-type HINT domain-containing protein [Nakamurella antarctica]AZI58100.1 hypothetical protein EH165_08060 [Nakamurella antarctica]